MKSEEISKYIKKIRALEYKSQVDDRLIIKLEDTCYMSKAGIGFDELTADDFVEIQREYMMEAKVLMSIKSAQALMISAPKFSKLCIKDNIKVGAVVDDFAQIIGHKAPVVKKNTRKLVSSLKSGSAVLVDAPNALMPGYAISIGRNPYEAVVAMTILEKSAEIVLKASVLGGAKELGFMLVNAHRRKYLNKYSKAERRVANEKKR